MLSGCLPVRTAITDGIFFCRDYTVVLVLNRNLRLMDRTVIRGAAGCEHDNGVGHFLRLDGHWIVQLCARRVIVVAVALHPVPDLVITRAGPSGEAGGIGPVVQRVFHRAFCGGTRRVYQRQGKAGVLQTSRRRGGGHICYLRLKNRCGGGNRGDDIVLCVDTVRESQAVNDDGLVFPDIFIREMSLRFCAGNVVSGNQTAADGDG